jgi:16S rRNA (guanine966-N2)-methyltransferase
VRVISGTARGFKLKGPPSTATRPMADKIKGALFSMLASLGVEFDRVLDLYAGTGSIGIEALSRGASSVDFVDQAPAACAVVRANLDHTKFTDRARVHTIPVASYLTRREQPYDFVIMDPPYADPAIPDMLAKLAGSSLVQSGTIVAVGHSPRVSLPEQTGRMERIRERCHGDSCFSIYEVDPSLADEPPADDQAGD